MTNPITDPARAAQVSWLLAAAALLAVLELHLLDAGMGGRAPTR